MMIQNEFMCTSYPFVLSFCVTFWSEDSVVTRSFPNYGEVKLHFSISENGTEEKYLADFQLMPEDSKYRKQWLA